MSQRPPGLQAVMEKAVEACITHVETGGLPSSESSSTAPG